MGGKFKGMMGMMGSGMGGGARGRTGGVPGVTRGVGASTSNERKKVGPRGTKRTEFIILFVWQEPTPSDSLLPPAGDGSGGDASGFVTTGN